MQRHINLVVFLICLFLATAAGALVSPRDGGPLPQAFYDIKDKDPTAFTMTRAWIQKAQRIREQRERYLSERLAGGPATVSALPAEFAVSGTIQVPVFLCAFSNVPAPFTAAQMQTQLFDDPANSVTDYYDEVSYGNLVMTGTVYDPVQLAYSDLYYEGGCNGILCSNGKVGSLIQEILVAKDPVVDFSIYDNDGPDGIPNSGDDDGFVDFVSFIHPEFGGECGSNPNLWSHRWVYEGWPESGGVPFETNDPAAGGGFIKVNDYTLQPAKSCDNTSIIEIGVFCHEFGHALGLPDLYDYDGGGGNGIGHWGIMGSGNWNMPGSPAHPCAWTRMEMGWITPTDVTWDGGTESISSIGATGDAFRLGFTNEQFRRTRFCAINGDYSLYCGLDSLEGFARGWGATSLNEGGYGNNWSETLEREFTWDGTTPVSFGYTIDFDTEPAMDYAYALIEIEGTETVLNSYTGLGDATENIDISSHFSGLTPPVVYKLKFRGTSDFAWSDDDNGHNTLCGIFVVDDVSVTGGGENYSNDFETTIGGWHGSRAVEDRQEFFLIENRQKYGYDQYLHGTGLLVMHVDQHIMHSPELNSSDNRLRGLLVEEADGQYNLNQGLLNKGDAGDPFPGSTNNRTFDAGSWPWTKSNNGHDTQAEMSNIGDDGETMTAFLRAGDPGPGVTSVLPVVINNDQVAVNVAIEGTGIQYGATFYFVLNTPAPGPAPRAPSDAENIVPVSVRWVDTGRLEGTVNVYSKAGGFWDLVVINPDGQQALLDPALSINEVVATQLQSATVEVVDGNVRLEYVLFDREPGETIRLSRSTLAEGEYRLIAGDLEPLSENRYVYVDENVEAGRTYYYKLEVLTPGEGARELHRGVATVPAGQLTMAQNFPNPFNPTTSISFYLPERTRVRLEVYDVTGRLVTRLAEGVFSAGPHSVNWHGVDAMGTRVGSGMYVYRLTAGKQVLSRKMLLLK